MEDKIVWDTVDFYESLIDEEEIDGFWFEVPKKGCCTFCPFSMTWKKEWDTPEENDAWNSLLDDK